VFSGFFVHFECLTGVLIQFASSYRFFRKNQKSETRGVKHFGSTPKRVDFNEIYRIGLIFAIQYMGVSLAIKVSITTSISDLLMCAD